MASQLATVICILFVIFLFWMDSKMSDSPSKALWIPLVWMFIAGSRFVSRWLDLRGPGQFPDAYFDGSPLDRALFLILIIAGVVLLWCRRVKWGELVIRNPWIWLFFVYGAISIVWSDYPLISFKRWIKALGNVVMGLVILTDQRPYEAIGIIIRRLTFMLVPLSVLLIKWYPDLGRAYHMGKAMFVGVADQKNGLGQICLFTGIYFWWSLVFFNGRKAIELGGRIHYPTYFMIIPMIAWLLYVADSATSLLCLIVAGCLLLISRQSMVAREPHRILVVGSIFIAIIGVLEISFDITEIVVRMLGRELDLTTRVPMWEDLLNMVKNPIVGFGFESFWLGDRRNYMLERWGIDSQAHNGYLEMYLNLGLLGVFILVCWILSGLKKVARHLTIDYQTAMLRLCFIVVAVLSNWTEATFYGVNNMWIILFLSIMDMSGQQEDDREKLAAPKANK